MARVNLVLIALCLASVPLCVGQRKDRKPGKLLLNMLIKDEAEHLERSLPKWAPLIDYWIVGIDDKNTDNSAEVVKKHLGHLPGELVVVKFDGMGPTWTELVKIGIKNYPNATHGLISDADFTPITRQLDKWELNTECSKHMYMIRSPGNSGNVRNMDWIYRNLPGAKVERRTHQSVKAPAIPGQEVFQTLINLEVQEYAGGYQDRTGNKSKTYISWLLKDLEEMPGDSRTVYYLGHAHLELIGNNPAQDYHNGGPGKPYVETALKYFRLRAQIRKGYQEERYFAMLKAGEICERYTHDYTCSIDMWGQATRLDPERTDAWFYVGQHYRLAGEPVKAIANLKTASALALPPRSMFQWMYLYDCLRFLELGRAVNMARDGDVTDDDLHAARVYLKKAKASCSPGEAREAADIRKSVRRRQKARAAAAAAAAPPPPPPAEAEEEARAEEEEPAAGDDNPAVLRAALTRLDRWHRVNSAAAQGLLEDAGLPAPALARLFKRLKKAVRLARSEDAITCDAFRAATSGYLAAMAAQLDEVARAFRGREPEVWAGWAESTLRLWPLCRPPDAS